MQGMENAQCRKQSKENYLTLIVGDLEQKHCSVLYIFRPLKSVHWAISAEFPSTASKLFCHH
jgi:hypothetical protein